MVYVKTGGQKINIVGNCIAKLARYFSVISLNIIFTSIKIFEKNILLEKISVSNLPSLLKF